LPCCCLFSLNIRAVILSAAQSKDPETAHITHTDQTFSTTELKRIKMAGYTYIMGSQTGTLYIGVTSDIYIRVQQHKNGTFEGFSKEHNCTRLLYYEQHENITQSIAREKQLKGWRREKKLNLIRTQNPDFKDFAETWGWKLMTANEKMNP
jgi:putative endonuclease